jgi:hypothetical protein
VRRRGGDAVLHAFPTPRGALREEPCSSLRAGRSLEEKRLLPLRRRFCPREEPLSAHDLVPSAVAQDLLDAHLVAGAEPATLDDLASVRHLRGDDDGRTAAP